MFANRNSPRPRRRGPSPSGAASAIGPSAAAAGTRSTAAWPTSMCNPSAAWSPAIAVGRPQAASPPRSP